MIHQSLERLETLESVDPERFFASLEDVKQQQDEMTAPASEAAAQADEEGGPKGKEPTRYGDWEKKGLAVDF